MMLAADGMAQFAPAIGGDESNRVLFCLMQSWGVPCACLSVCVFLI